MNVPALIITILLISGLSFLIVWEVIGLIKQVKKRKQEKQDKQADKDNKKGE